MRTGKTIGTLAADNLIVDGKHDLDVKGVNIVQAANAKAQEVSVEEDMTASKAYASGDLIQVVHMLPGYTHNIINLSETENLVTLMWANEQFDRNHPDTFGEKV